ncbi:hypothetical protein FSP39_013321 [Pinctada imbricata]|uniref:YqaJ viral recombinase domain-containing protein n=1 Tax=Pinctada imbricata TaxID=66713 RepID=A0AA88YLM3_PINIB|nr:hypothetical protein FSP39_013321 [Pinctada imbricata]
MNSSYDFRSWKVPDLSNYLNERGISVSLRRKNEIVRLCELANELQLEVISSTNDFQDMDINRRTVLNGQEKVIVDDISTIIDWATSLSNLPDIDFCDIFLYLMNSCKWDDERLKNYKNDNGTNALLLQTLRTESDESDGDSGLPTLADVVKDSDRPPIEAIKTIFDHHTIRQIEEETRGQSDNPAWFLHRRGRITASLIPSVISFRYTDNNENYLSKQILGTSARISSASLQFGKTHEPIARQLYMNEYVRSHKGVNITQGGLFIDHENPFLGASPDGLVSCKCCGKGLLEIKCSFSHQNKTPIQICEDSHYHVYADENNEMRLKTSSSWYIQIQAQLGVCKRNWCDFLLFTKRGHAVDRILYDDELFLEITQKSRKFFERYIMNSL